MSIHHINMAKAGGSKLSHWSTYRNGHYPEVVIRHFRALSKHFLLIEKSRKAVDLVVLDNSTILQAAHTAECIFEMN